MNYLKQASVLTIAVVALWLGRGVDAGDVVRFIGYELGFVLVPGWLALRAIAPGIHSRLWQLALGWTLGLTFEMLAFSFTAALDARDAFVAYPVVVGLPALAVMFARRPRGERPPEDRAAPLLTERQAWTLTGLCLLVIGYLGLELMTASPLPGSVPKASYVRDLMFHSSLVADAKHHWPIGQPIAAGLDFHYHFLFHIHAAAISQVTGLDVSVLVLRLAIVPLVVLLALQMTLAARALTGIGWAGPIATALLLLVCELDLNVPDMIPWLGRTDVWLAGSQSTVLGLIFFIPLLALLGGLLDEEVLERLGGSVDRRALWLLIALLLVGASWAKGFSVPMLAAGLGLYLVVVWLRHGREIDRTAVAAFGLCAIVAIASAAILYPGVSGGQRIGIGQIYGQMPALYTLRPVVPDALEIPFWGLGSVAATLFYFGPSLLGLYWAIGPGRPPLPRGQLLGLCVLAISLPTWLFLYDDVGGNYYFSAYGVVAALPVVAAGLCRGLGAWARGPAGDVRRVLGLTGVWVVFLLAVVALGWHWVLDGHPAWSYALIYPAFAVGVLAMLVLAIRAPAAEKPWRTALVVLAILVPAGLDMVLDSGPEAARAIAQDRPLYDAEGYDAITPFEHQTAVWVRDNTDEDAIYALRDPGAGGDLSSGPQDVSFPALSERRAFYAGWAFLAGTDGWYEVGDREYYPKPHRHRLQERLYVHGDLKALREMQDRYGVTHLVFDRASAPAPPVLYRQGRVVYSNAEYDVIELR